jgi:1,2-phenylacetyl-CoA epoxidase PaaB subunit
VAWAELPRWSSTRRPRTKLDHERGISFISANGEMQITARNASIRVVPDGKDAWTDPRTTVIATAPGAAAASIKKSLTVAQDVSLDG